MTERITSRKNPLLEHVRKLDSAAYRRQTGTFLCDSPKLVDEALHHGVAVQCVITADGVPFPADLPDAVRRVSVPADVMTSVSPLPTPQGTLALCALPALSPPDSLPDGRYVVLDGVQDSGNVGAVLRTADAFHADGMFLVNGCADLYNPKTLRATMGAVFRCPVWTTAADELSALLKRSGIPLYGAALRDDTLDARTVDYRRCAIAIGSEGRGLTEGVLALCDRTIKIPMSEHCESLNAAAATTVLLWEAARND